MSVTVLSQRETLLNIIIQFAQLQHNSDSSPFDSRTEYKTNGYHNYVKRAEANRKFHNEKLCFNLHN
jgi:hypothetical protein